MSRYNTQWLIMMSLITCVILPLDVYMCGRRGVAKSRRAPVKKIEDFPLSLFHCFHQRVNKIIQSLSLYKAISLRKKWTRTDGNLGTLSEPKMHRNFFIPKIVFNERTTLLFVCRLLVFVVSKFLYIFSCENKQTYRGF